MSCDNESIICVYKVLEEGRVYRKITNQSRSELLKQLECSFARKLVEEVIYARFTLWRAAGNDVAFT